MKKILLSVFCLSVMFLPSFGQSTVPNSGFEKWTNNGFVTDPDGFTGSNFLYFFTDMLAEAFGAAVETPASVTKYTPASSGNFAVKISNVASIYLDDQTVGDPLSGFIVNTTPGASLGIGDSDDNVGTTFTSRPISLKAMYMFNQGATSGTEKDVAGVFAWLTKWNANTMESDTIGIAEFITTETKTAYTELNVPFVYQSELKPDTIRIGVFSSVNEDAVSTDTYIVIDDISFDYAVTGIATPALKNGNSPQLYPNPTVGNSMVRDMPLNAAKLSVINSFGIEVFASTSANLEEVVIPSANFQAGMYIVNFLDENNNIMLNQKLIVRK
jgi:hypothetical protein